MAREKECKRIVIVGGGFGGLRVALDLESRVSCEHEIILIDQKDCHIPHPMLYEVATAFLGKENRLDFSDLYRSVAIPYQELLLGKRIVFIEGEVEKFSLSDSNIRFTDGSTLLFDYLVLALGSITKYPSVEGLREHSFPLKTVDDALNVRNSIEELFLRKGRDERIDIVIAGGGFTGVEFAGELALYVRNLRERDGRAEELVSITIVEGGSSVLPGMSPEVVRAVSLRLETLGIIVISGSMIVQCLDGRAFLDTRLSLAADVLIWTAGIAPSPVTSGVVDVPIERGYLLRDEYLRIPSRPSVFAVGDNALCFDSVGKPLPATAQRAIAEGALVAENIYRSTRELPLIGYLPKRPAFVIPVGGKYAVADLWGFRLFGFAAWLLKMIIEYKYLLSIMPIKEATKRWVHGLKLYTQND